MKKLLFLLLVLPASSLFGQAVNDECADRITISPGVGDFNEFTVDTSTATESLDASCDTGTQNNLDVWYEFTMPVSGNLRVTNVPNTVRSVIYDSCGGTELDCITDDGFFYNLVGGTTYVFRLSERDTFAGTVNFRLEAFETAANDECADRETVVVTTSSTTNTTMDYRAATESLDSSCETIANANLDLWYEFTMPVNGNVRITGIPNTVVRALYDSCGGTELACDTDDGFFYNLSSGTTYVLRMAERSIFAGEESFNIQAFETATNDECLDRETVVVTTTSTTNTAMDFRAATESLDASCQTAVNDNLDLWYEFTMPVNGNIRITGIPNTVSRTLYDSCGGVELECDTDDGFFYNLNSGTTYVLRMSERSLFASVESFNIQAFESAINDQCANRTAITVITGAQTNTTMDFRTATETLESSCETAVNANLDLWYEFTMPVNGNVRITGIPNTVSRTLYDSCGGVEISCDTDDGFYYNLNSGTTYVLRMAERGLFASEESFDIRAFETAANDECSNREMIGVTTDASTTTALDFRAAMESVDGSCEVAINDQLDLWYEFTMPVDGNIKISGIPSTIFRTLYDSCGGVELACDADDGFFYSLSSGTTYVLRMSQRALFATDEDFNIRAYETAVNDDCTDALPLVVGTVSPINYAIEFRGATESLDGSCDTVVDDNLDVWYTFEMPVDGSLDLTGVPSTVIFALYDGCGGTELDCFANDGSFTGLSAGQELWLRVRERALFATSRTFDVMVTPDSSPSCSGTTTWSGGSWSAGAPDKATSAVIADNYSTATNGSISACDCTINVGFTLDVAAGDYLQTTNNIIVDGTLNVAHEGSVVQVDPAAQTINNGTVNVRKTTPVLAAKDFMLMSSPVSGETRDGVYISAWRAYGHNAANFSPNPEVALAFPDAEVFIDDNGDDRVLLGLSDPLISGTGYLVFPQASPTEAGMSYDLNYSQGTLNSGNIAFPVVFNGTQEASFNLMGNPYASTLDAVDFIQSNAMVDAIYLWEHNTSPSDGLPGYLNFNYSMEDVSVFNLTGGIAAASSPGLVPNQYIASGQGFAIKATAAGTAQFSNSMRRNFNNNTLRSSEFTPSAVDRLWVQLEATEFQTSSTALVGFMSAATSNLDPGYDTKRLATYVSIYSHGREAEELGIQAVEAFDTDRIVYLGIASQLRGDQKFSISLKQLEGSELSRAQTYLYDTVTGTWTDLAKEDHHFLADEGNHPYRFELHFTKPSASQWVLKAKAFPNPTAGMITLQNNEAQISEAKLFDMLGRELWSTETPFNQIEIDLSNFPKATYLLHYQTAGTWQVTQIVVR
ncbi:T9SS type A sorting domain-containing protein [Gilvibacter sp.]|uniref:T9SS type A sorting domain-containing protein n=1 Tax=Gilvibacter sp. TaxID=2729997 RepID=UPI003F49E89E